MNKSRYIKQLSRTQKRFQKAGKTTQAALIQSEINKVKSIGMYKYLKQEKNPQKQLFWCQEKKVVDDLVIQTHQKYCVECGRLFWYPRTNSKPKCISCKVQSGSLDEARRDLELYELSDISKNHIHLLNKIRYD